MMLPKFKYSPNAYTLKPAIFEEIEGVCSICNNKRQLKYIGSFYSVETPDYICPWCIKNGTAAKMYDGSFNDYCGIEGVFPDPNAPEPTTPLALLLEVTDKTPSYASIQQEQWLTHCNEPCAFIGHANKDNIKPVLKDISEDIKKQYQSVDVDDVLASIYNGAILGYLFKCIKCNKYRLHTDYS